MPYRVLSLIIKMSFFNLFLGLVLVNNSYRVYIPTFGLSGVSISEGGTSL
jgi:hypothetical protein